MGGNALKIVKTKRYSKEEYVRISNKITEQLPFETYIPKSFGAKESFGDLDVLIRGDSYTKFFGNKPMYDYIKETFNPTEIYNNSNVVSFDNNQFQIDFIKVKESDWHTSKKYFEFNDLGNLIGRIAYQMGFRYGHYGLKLVYRHDDGGKKFEKMITKKMFDILQFLGFDPDRYVEGFYNLTDIFDYVINSKYFNPKIFQYEVLNHQNKTRNKKRVNYAGFLEYVDKYDFKGRKFYEYQDKDYYVDMVEKYFNIDIVNQVEEWNKEVKLDKLISAKFNGTVIMERYPDLKGKKLGNSITKFKDYIKRFLGTQAIERGEVFESDFLYRQWIVDSDIEHIFSHFKIINNLEKTVE